MKISALAEKLNLKRLSGESDKEVTNCYLCDLLSRAMNGCTAGTAWITVQTSLNVVAVATLTDIACVIIPEGIEVPTQVLLKADEEDITFFSSDKSAFYLAGVLSREL